MTFDELAPAWHAQNVSLLSPVDRDALLVRVFKRVESLNRSALAQDVVETIAALVVLVGYAWSMYLWPADYVVSRTGAVILVCYALFLIYMLRPRRATQPFASPDAPLREFIRAELNRLDRRIRMTRTALWWSVLPCVIGVNIVFVGLAGMGAPALIWAVLSLLFFWGSHAVAKWSIAKSLAPARNELASLLNQLGDDVALIEQPQMRSSKLRRIVSALVLLASATVLGLAAFDLVGQANVEYPKRAPFTDVRWDGSKPQVKIGEEWFALISLDGIPAEDIVTFSWWTYMDRWRKRFEEDLVEVLTRMGHPPHDTVTLVVQPLTTSEPRTLNDVPMTEDNRRAIYKAARDREQNE